MEETLMRTDSHTDHTTTSSSVMQRLSGAFIAGRYRATLKAMRRETPESLEQVIANPAEELDTLFAAEIEHMLATGGAPYVRFDQTLMPLMQARFGLGKSHLAQLSATERKQLGKTCNNCSVVAQCWRALRSNESAEVCSTFCPNAGTFERLADTLPQAS